MIISKTSNIKPKLHIKKIDFTKEYLDFCYSHNADKGEIHHIIPKVILKKRIADQMTVTLSQIDHMTAHWLLVLSLVQRGKYDIVKKIGYSKPFISADQKYRAKMISHARFAVKGTNEWFTLKEVYNKIIIPECTKMQSKVPLFEQFFHKLLTKSLLSEKSMYFRRWKVYVC